MWQNNKKVIIALMLGLILGYAAGRSWSNAGVAGSAKSPSVSMSDNQTTDLLTVEDQAAGVSVRVRRVVVDRPTWLTVQEDNQGAPGAIMGATLLPEAGERTEVAVDLIVPSVAETKYHLNLYADNGDQRFDNHADLPIKDEDGAVIDATFSTL